jgi:hypothetical protein
MIRFIRRFSIDEVSEVCKIEKIRVENTPALPGNMRILENTPFRPRSWGKQVELKTDFQVHGGTHIYE